MTYDVLLIYNYETPIRPTKYEVLQEGWRPKCNYKVVGNVPTKEEGEILGQQELDKAIAAIPPESQEVIEIRAAWQKQKASMRQRHELDIAKLIASQKKEFAEADNEYRYDLNRQLYHDAKDHKRIEGDK